MVTIEPSATANSGVDVVALGCTHWRVGVDQCAWGYLWTWAENQVLAAVKAVPLGQSAGQRMLDALIAQIPKVAQDAASLNDESVRTDDTLTPQPWFHVTRFGESDG